MHRETPANSAGERSRVGLLVGALVAALLASSPAIAELPPAPALESLSEEPFDPADYDGRTLLINFWAAWCGPCRAEMPDLDELQKHYAAEPFQVIGVAADERASVEKFLEAVPVDYPIYIGDPDEVFDWSGQLGNRAFALPFSVLVDRSGNKRWQKLGGRISVADIAPVIDGLLAEESPPPTKPAGMPDFGDAPPPLPRGGAGVKPVMPGTAAPDGLGVTMARSPTAGSYDTEALTYVPWDDPADIRPLEAGAALPEGSVVRGGDGAEIDLNAAVRQQPTILIYYRGGWCPFCNAHLRELQGIVDELTGLGYQLLAISTDPVEAVRAHEESTNYSYRLLSDADLSVATKLGLKYRVVQEYIDHVKALPEGHAFDIVERTGGYLVTPATIVFDTGGVARFVYANNNYTVRISQAALLEAARAALEKTGGPPPQMPPPVAVAAPDRPFIPLGEGDASSEQWETFWGQLMVRNVGQAALYPVLPGAGTGNGQAVIVIPGGGYRFVSMQNEGFPVAEALAARGYSAFVLKYRTFPTARDGQAFMDEMATLFGTIGKDRLADLPAALDDLQNAHAWLRDHAGEYGIDPERIGAIGFSAGARTAIRYVEQGESAADLENVALIYPPMDRPAEGGVRPPLFLAIAVDDPLFQQGKLTLVENWLNESQALEFHLYSGGGHGFGTMGKGTTSEGWLDSYLAWLDLH